MIADADICEVKGRVNEFVRGKKGSVFNWELNSGFHTRNPPRMVRQFASTTIAYWKQSTNLISFECWRANPWLLQFELNNINDWEEGQFAEPLNSHGQGTAHLVFSIRSAELDKFKIKNL